MTVIFMIMMIIFTVSNPIVTVTLILCILPTFNTMHNVSITVTVIFMIMMIIFTLFMTVFLNTSTNTTIRVFIIFGFFIAIMFMRDFDIVRNNFPRHHFTSSYHAETNAWG